MSKCVVFKPGANFSYQHVYLGDLCESQVNDLKAYLDKSSFVLLYELCDPVVQGKYHLKGIFDNAAYFFLYLRHDVPFLNHV